MKSLPKLSISFGNYSLKDHKTAEYLGCYLHSNINGESVARRINTKLKCPMEAKQLFELFV